MAEFKPAPGTEASRSAETPQTAGQALQSMDDMQLIYLLCLLAVIVAINWRFLGLDRLFGFPRGHPKGCEWIRDDAQETGDGQKHWVCMTCGRRTAQKGGPPRDCLRGGR